MSEEAHFDLFALPHIVALHILEYVPFVQRLVLRRVSKRFMELVEHQKLLKNISLVNSYKLRDDQMDILLKKVHSVVYLDLFNCFSLAGQCLIRNGKRGKFVHLKRLCVCLTNFSDTFYKRFLPRCSELQVLDLRMTNTSNDIARIIRHMPNIRELRCCGEMWNEDFFVELLQCDEFGHSLELLDTSFIPLSNAVILKLLMRFVNLKTLCLQGSDIDEDVHFYLSVSCKNMICVCVCNSGASPHKMKELKKNIPTLNICDGTYEHHSFFDLRLKSAVV